MNEYFSHDYRARYDNKLVNLVMKHGLAGLGAFWCIVEILYESDGYVERSQYERIAYELRIDADFIKSVVEDFKLFQFKGDKFYSETALDRLKQRNEKSEKARKSVEKRWSKYQENKHLNKGNTNVLPPKNKRNTNKSNKNKEKDNKENTLSSISPLEENLGNKKIRHLIPPTLQMVAEYCTERNNGVNPQKFIDHYTAKNWLIGKQKMCDWQAAVRTWENEKPTPQASKKYGKA